MTQSPASTSPKSARLRALLRWLLPLLLFLLLLFFPVRVGIAGYRTYSTLRQLAIQIRRVEHPADLQAAQPTATTLRADMAHLRDTLMPLMPLLDRLAFVPRYGPILAAADEVAEAGEDAAAILDKALELIQSATFEQDDRGAAAWVERCVIQDHGGSRITMQW